MTKEEEKILDDMETLLSQYKKQKQEKQSLKDNKPITKNDLKELITELKQPQTTTATPAVNQPSTKKIEQEERTQIAVQIWKDAKATSVICMIAIILPMITIFASMISPSMALVVSLMGIIYPCFVFVKMINIQTLAYRKYGLKPLFQFPQQRNIGMQYQNQQKQKRGDNFI